jgi:hypothetical protein
MERFVHALFPNQEAAARAVDALVNANFSPGEVAALVADHRHHVHELVPQRKTPVRAGALVGVVVGAAGGALTLAGLGWVSLTSPAQALQAAATGGAVGLFAGALAGLGYWRHAIDFPEDAFRNGAVLVGVATHTGRIERARSVLCAAGARRTYACSKRAAALRALDRTNIGARSIGAPRAATKTASTAIPDVARRIQ